MCVHGGCVSGSVLSVDHQLFRSTQSSNSSIGWSCKAEENNLQTEKLATSSVSCWRGAEVSEQQHLHHHTWVKIWIKVWFYIITFMLKLYIRKYFQMYLSYAKLINCKMHRTFRQTNSEFKNLTEITNKVKPTTRTNVVSINSKLEVNFLQLKGQSKHVVLCDEWYLSVLTFIETKFDLLVQIEFLPKILIMKEEKLTDETAQTVLQWQTVQS